MATNPDEIFADLVPKSASGPVYGAPPKPDKPQAKSVSGRYIVDPNSGTAAPITGMPRPHVLSPEEAKASNLDPSISWQIDANGDYKKLGDAPAGGTADEKVQAAMGSTRNLLQSIEKARGLVSNWSTGLGGAVGKLYPGSDQAKQLDSIVHQELRGNIFQNWVAQLKATSDTGTSGIGRIMQSEIPLVTGALGALDPVAMGKDQTLNSFDQIENRVLRSAALLNHENPDDPKVLQKYREQFIPHTAPGATPPGSGGGGSGGGGGGGPPGVSQLSPDQQSAEQAFRATNPTPEQYASFLTGVLGKQVTVDSAKARLDAAAKGAPYNPGVQDLTEQQKVKDRIATEDKLGLNESPATTLLKQGSTLNLSDEAAGVGNAAANVLTSPLTGNFDPVGSYKTGRDVERQRIQDARDKLGYGGTAIEFAGGLASASPTNALAALDIPTLMRQGAKAGAFGGALAGFGSGEGPQQSITGAGIGAAGGAAVGALAPYAAGKLAARGQPKGMAPDLANAAQAEGVDLIHPMVDPASRGKFGALESAPGSQNVIRAGIDKTKTQIESRVGDLAKGGVALDSDAAGGIVQNAARRFIQRSKGVADTLYNRARSISGDATVTPRAALLQLRQELMSLKETPGVNQGQIDFLNKLGDDLTQGPLSVNAVRGLRTGIRDRINESGLTATQADARASRVLDALQQDVTSSLPPAAATAYRRADAFYRERMNHVDDIISRFLGPRDNPVSGEQAFTRLKTMASPGGDARRLSGLMRDLDPSERQDIAATVASRLGRRSQDEPFSTDLLLSQTNKLSPSAQNVLFGADGAKSIANLRLLSQKLKEGVGDLNRSKTANSMLRMMASRMVGSLTGLGGAAGLLEGGMSGGGTGAATGLLVGGAVKGAQVARNVLSARAMVNPRVSQWLAQAANVSTPSQAQQAVKGLSLVISREPALAHELTPIRDFLDQRVGELLAAKPAAPDQQDNQQR